MATTLTAAPSSITAGESVAWTISLPDYNPSTWTLKYALQAPGKPVITFGSTDDGSGNHAVALPTVQTANFAPGTYALVAFVQAPSSNPADERYVISRGLVRILPSIAQLTGCFTPSHATRMLGLIEAALEGRIPNGLEKTNIDGQELERIPVVDLAKLHESYQRKVLAEQAAALAAAGVGRRKSIGIRFTNPR